MKFTFSWLKDHLDTDASLEAIVEKLSLIGLEVEGVEDRGAALKSFTVAYVKEAKPHPNADRLRVCLVDTGKETVQVVCGAPNARTGMKGVFAAVGSYIPGTDMTLKAGEIRGEASNGMLVSEREMGLSDEHDGIIDLPEDAPVGAPFAAIMGLDDPVIEIGITPNRGDCLGVRGIARDLAAAGLGRLKPLDYKRKPGSYPAPIKWTRDGGPAGDACPYVGGRHFRGVTNGPSPKWLRQRLTAIGLRPISALVDITNYVTFDLGRPLHVFDADKLQGDLIMRLAKPGEEIEALDEATYKLSTDMLVIADETGPQGIGGVMGGERSGVGEDTKNVFLEVALFDPIRVARTGRALGIISDARYRFERGLDSASGDWGIDVATDLILDLVGGEASEVTQAGAIPENQTKITLRASRCATLGGLDLPLDRQAAILGDLGFGIKTGKDSLEASVPSWRSDIEGEACLVEEVLRIHGFDAIPEVSLPRESSLPTAALTLGQKRVSITRRALARRGLEESISFSFVSQAEAAYFGAGTDRLELDNPISADLSVMRPSVLANLIPAAVRNADRGFGDLGLFEVGPAYHDDTPKGESWVAAGLRLGRAPRHWAVAERAVSLYDAKADVLAALVAIEAPVDKLQTTRDAPAWYHPGRSAVLRLGPKVLAAFGELHPGAARAMGLRGTATIFEIFLGEVPQPRSKSAAKPALHLSPFQPVRRDFAFLVDEAVEAGAIERAIAAVDKTLIAGIEFFDLYQGKGIDPGKKSLALTVTIQPGAKTLTTQEIDAVAEKIVAAVNKATGAVLRT